MIRRGLYKSHVEKPYECGEVYKFDGFSVLEINYSFDVIDFFKTSNSKDIKAHLSFHL